jgi:hypothetical protein
MKRTARLLAIAVLVAIAVVALLAEIGPVFLWGGPPSSHSTRASPPPVAGPGGPFRWTNLTHVVGAAPALRTGAAVAYDAADRYVVLFGGLSASGHVLGDTWTYHAGRWTDLNLSASSSPPARAFAAMTYDAADGYLLLFGGSTAPTASDASKLNDTWSFHGGAWSRIPTTSAPRARYGASLTYDPNASEVVLFGGNSTVGPSDDCWTYAAGRWSHLAIPTPSPRVGAAMTYDATYGVVVLMAGDGLYSQASHPLNWTWVFNGTAWAHAIVTTFDHEPRLRDGAMLASSGNTTILVGGATDYSEVGQGVEPFFLTGLGRSTGHPAYQGSVWVRWTSQLQSAYFYAGPPVGLPDAYPLFVYDAADGYFLYAEDGFTYSVPY